MDIRAVLAAVAVLVAVCAPRIASAHEVRPAYLRISERTTGALPSGHYDVLWKQPTMGTLALHLVPRISGGLLDRTPSTVEFAAGFQISRWRNLDAGASGLEGRTLSIEGLDQTITDVLVSITLANGETVEKILIPQHPFLKLRAHQDRLAALDFLTLGVRHILTGPDHLLFLLGLLIIVRERWMLLKTVSAFTVAHSMTLAAATLADIRLSTPLLNALIALSILFVAIEAIHAQRTNGARTAMSLMIRYPWVGAFAFGLLHGMGFATGLTSLGLAKGALLSALVLFNIGVEIGQLAFIALILALQRAFELMQFSWPRPVEFLPAYAIGTLGAFWTVQYSSIVLGGS